MPSWTRFQNDAPFRYVKLAFVPSFGATYYEVIDRSANEALGAIYRQEGEVAWRIAGDQAAIPQRFSTRASASKELYHRKMGGSHGDGDIS